MVDGRRSVAFALITFAMESLTLATHVQDHAGMGSIGCSMPNGDQKGEAVVGENILPG